MQARVGREITMHLHWQCAHTFFFFDFPGFIRVGDLPGGSWLWSKKPARSLIWAIGVRVPRCHTVAAKTLVPL